MPTNYSGRILLIVVVLLGALSAVFPPANIVNPRIPWGQKHDLRPGIDMVGGTKLLYEIKVPEGGYHGANTLAEDTMAALKRRVDPDGVRNLIWRPSGANRLEIQMPLSRTSGESKQRREAFAEAQRKLDATNIRPAQVTDAVEKLKGDERRARLNELALDSQKRAELFGAMASTWDQIQQAKAAKNAEQQARLAIQYDKLKEQITDTVLAPSDLQAALDMKGDAKTKKLDEIKKQYASFPSRLKAIDEFVEAYDKFSEVRSSIDDATDLKRLLKGSGVLEFHILAVPGSRGEGSEPNISADRYQAMVDSLQKQGPQNSSDTDLRWFEVGNPDEFKGSSVPWNNKQWVLAWITPEKSMVHGDKNLDWKLKQAYPATDQFGRSTVGFQFDSLGGSLFGKLSSANVHQQLAIMLDGKVISAPNLREAITGGSGEISGGGQAGFNRQELMYLVNTLNAGSLPATLADEPISEQTVGPQLGADNLHRGLYSCFIGLIVVGVFLFVYYHLSGIVAFVAVLMNLIIILGVMAMLNATFTLPAIAGIVLTIGAAVDANVLIFERLREEQHRGLSLRMALRNAYDHALTAIVDSNATTVITSLVLYWIGSEEVKGFGLTLLIGLLSSLFTSLFVTKTIFGLLIDKVGIKNLGSLPLSFPKWDRMLRPDIDWMKYAWIFMTFSAIVTVTGVASFAYYGHKGELLDIEFASGTSVQIDLKADHAMPIEKVRARVASNPVLESSSIVSVGTADRSYQIVSPDPDTARVRDEISKLFESDLDVDPKVSFAKVGAPLDEALNDVVVPIKLDTDEIAGIRPSNISAFRGGVAIVLNNLDPKLTPEQIRTRIDRQRLQSESSSSANYRDLAVVSEGGPDQPTAKAIVLESDPHISYQQDEARWRESVAVPAWKNVNDALATPARLQQVTSFNPQVAGDTQRDALVAMVLSLMVIMAYIWLRFGDLKYGAATVLAMVHDTLLVVGSIGLAHFLYHNVHPIAQLLLIEPFRLNLTMVAAILTIMSYSMIDTIVVFDRVRENRGKYGHLDRKVMNDSINQTLSRTLLTAGTTCITVFVMYVSGGAGIHGFTFVLLFGILIGTYSSIAIAAPFLLLTRKQPPAAGSGKENPARQLQRVG
jgi:SecD/SecF fusion protein